MENGFIMGDIWLKTDGVSMVVIDSSGEGWVKYFEHNRIKMCDTVDFLRMFYPCNPEKFLDNL